nr:hypothetical protein [Tanacetum cinerariifolium]
MRNYFRRSWEADREKERNERLYDMEGFVEYVEDVCEEDGIVAKNLITDELKEVVAMINDVTDQEIKLAMFTIDDCKALGPDGYTACLYKKACLVIGNDVCLAIKEFFNSGKMLKEINPTLISLILKVHHPKLVTKVPLFKEGIFRITYYSLKNSSNGYNRKGGCNRCALKIDIAKAYDIVHIVKLKGKSFWEVSTENNDSWMWKCLLGLRDKAKLHIEYIAGNGKRISAWYDKWNEMGPLCHIINSRDLYNARYDKKAIVADMIHNNQ